MKPFAYIRNGEVASTSEKTILQMIKEDFGVQHSRQFFSSSWSDAGREAFNTYRIAYEGSGQDTVFTHRTVAQPAYDAEEDRVVAVIGEQDRPLDQVKEQLRSLITRKFREVRDGGTVVNDINLATTNDAWSELTGAVERTAGGDTIKAVTRSGARLQMDNATATALKEAVSAHREASQEREFYLYQEVEDAADMNALRAIDIETGWPANPES